MNEKTHSQRLHLIHEATRAHERPWAPGPLMKMDVLLLPLTYATQVQPLTWVSGLSPAPAEGS